MTPTRWRRIEALFAAASDLPPEDRTAFLEREAVEADGSPDLALREEVERLIALDDGAETFVESLRQGVAEAPPPEVPPWRLVARVGEGGMGEVWRAERADGAFEQTAAVKLVRPGLAPDLVARFRAERHLLARLDHPAVARLLDGGTASDGRPYLATEFVDGEPITAYCDRRRLTVNERLALFEEVCAAVAAAHRQLVVHRDLKPSNVLVAETPDGPRVKLLDFGIAKLLDDEAGFTVPVTAAERRVLTPEYAAPEQVRGEPPTTATDVYGLGVLLYELLTGTRPYRAESRARRAVEDAILHAEPTEPSTAVTAAASAEAAAARATEPGRLRRRLRGDLDRIVLKALRKEPERRYDGAAALAADVERHLAGLPIEARPESAAYRVGKFARRHRAGVAAALVALLALVGGATLALWQAAEARAERDRAETQTRQAEAVSSFVAGLFGEADPNQSAGDSVTVAAALARGARRARTELAGAPDTRAAVLATIGRVYREQGRLEDADRILAEASAGDGLSPQTRADVLEEVAALRSLQGDYPEAERLFRRVLSIRTEAEGAEALSVGGALDNVGAALFLQRDLEGAEDFRRRAVALYRRRGAVDGPDYAAAVGNLGVVLVNQDRFGEAGPLLREALARERAVHGDTSLAAARALNNLGSLHQLQGDFDRAEAVYLAAIDRWRAILGEDHPNVAIGLSNVGSMHIQADDADRARPFLLDALSRFRSALGDDHPDVGFTLEQLATLERVGGRLDRSARYAREALAVYGETLEPGHLYVGTAEHTLGRTLRLQRDPAAEAHYRRALSVFAAALSPSHQRTLDAQIELGEMLADGGRQREARPLLRAALSGARAAGDSARVAEAEAALRRLAAR